MLCSTDDFAFLRDDGQEYKDIATQLAAGRGFSVSSYRWYEAVPPGSPGLHTDFFRPPLLPLLGAPLCWLPVKWEVAARVEVFVIGMLLVAMAMLLASEIASDTSWAATVTGLLFALHPAVLHYSRKFSTEQLAALCVLAALYAWVRTVQGPESKKWGFLTGVALGLCTLSRPNLFLVVIAVVLGTAWLAWRQRIWAKQALVFLLAGALLLLGPWTVRQGMAGAGWQPVTAFGPYAYWMGNHPDELAAYRATDSQEFLRLQNALNLEDTRAVIAPMEDERLFLPAQTGPRWMATAFRWQRENPSDALALLGYRLVHIIRPWPSLLAFSAAQALVLGVANLSCMVLALYWFRRQGFALLRGGGVWFCVAANIFGAVPFLFVLRYRFPSTEVPLLVIAGAGLALFIQTRDWRAILRRRT